VRKRLGLHYKPFCHFGWWKPVIFLGNPPGAPAKVFKTAPSIESWVNKVFLLADQHAHESLSERLGSKAGPFELIEVEAVRAFEHTGGAGDPFRISLVNDQPVRGLADLEPFAAVLQDRRFALLVGFPGGPDGRSGRSRDRRLHLSSRLRGLGNKCDCQRHCPRQG
jgi:hypothetical protein